MKTTSSLFIFPIALVFFEVVTYLANDMYLPGLPNLIADLSIHQDTAQLTLLYWFLGSASMQLFMGPLSDRFGRKAIILLSAFFYVIASFYCALSNNIEWMLFARFVQGVAVCAVGVAGYAAIHERYDAKTAMKIVSIMYSITIMAPALGPLIGAIIIQFYSWRAIFYFLGLLGMINLFSLMKVMPETLTQKTPLHIRDILKDFCTISTRIAFLGYALPACLLMMAFVLWIIESPFIIIETYQQSTLMYGYIQFIIFLSYFLGGFLTKMLIHRLKPTYLILLGLSIAACASFLLVIVSFTLKTYVLPLVVALMCLLSLGSALIAGPLNRMAVETCSEPMGRRMAIFSTLLNLFCVLGSFLVTLYEKNPMQNLALLIFMSLFIALLIFILFNRSQHFVAIEEEVLAE